MSCALDRFAGLALVFILLSGCGDNSNGGGSGGNVPPPAPTTVTFTFSGTAPAVLATRIGAGAFTAATLSSGKVTLTLPSGTTNFAVAYACTITSTVGSSQQTRENVFEASTLDGISFSERRPQLPTGGATGTLTGSIDTSAIPGASLVNIVAQNGSQLADAFVNTGVSSFSIAAPSGSDRVELVVYNTLINNNLQTTGATAARSFSGQTVPGALNGGNTVVLGAADETTQQTITYSGVPSGFSSPATFAEFAMSGGGGLSLVDSAANQYPVMPPGAVQSGDSYIFLSSAYNTPSFLTFSPLTLNPLEGVSVITTSSAASPLSVVFPAAWAYAGPTPAPLPVFSFDYAGFSGVSNTAGLTWTPAGTAEAILTVTATSKSLGGSTMLAIPDLSGVAGFLASPASGTSVTWEAQISQGRTPSAQSSPLNGVEASVIAEGTYIVP